MNVSEYCHFVSKTVPLERVGLSLTASKFYLSGQLQYSHLIVLKSHEIC